MPSRAKILGAIRELRYEVRTVAESSLVSTGIRLLSRAIEAGRKCSERGRDCEILRYMRDDQEGFDVVGWCVRGEFTRKRG